MKSAATYLFSLVMAAIAAGCAVAAYGNTSSEDGDISAARLSLRDLCRRAEAGAPEALYRLAYLHDIGYDSIPVDTLRSTALYAQAADSGYVPALNYLGFRYYSGQGVKKDIDKGIDLIERAAMAGDAHAASNMGWLLLAGKGVKHDAHKALFWLNRAAQADVPQAQSMLADILSDNIHLPADTLRAAELYAAAAARGVYEAAPKLVALMSDKWRELSADSAVNIGIDYYLKGIPTAGIALFRQAASQNNPRALALLGDAYTRAVGVGYDYNAALLFFVQAALLDNASAAFYLAELLEIFPDALSDSGFVNLPGGDILSDPDSLAADYWYLKAADAGVSNAEEAFKALFAK